MAVARGRLARWSPASASAAAAWWRARSTTVAGGSAVNRDVLLRAAGDPRPRRAELGRGRAAGMGFSWPATTTGAAPRAPVGQGTNPAAFPDFIY